MRPPSPTSFPALDGLRGAAALGIFGLHLMTLNTTEGEDYFHGYLAVDLFFLLSGFVVAHAYERRLLDGSLSFEAFVRLRMRRLWPMAALGTGLGALLLWSSPETAAAGPLWMLAAAGLALVPWLGATRLFPLDGPLWSLSIEVAANLAYARCVRVATTRRLLVLSAACFGGLAVWTAVQGSLSLGWSPATWGGGVLRIGFAFPLGVVMRRRLPSLPRPPLGVLPSCALVGAVFWAPHLLPLQRWQEVYDLVAIVAVFPVLLLAAAAATPPPWQVRLCRVLGGLSYPLYAVHEPVLRAMASVRTGPTAMTVSAVVALGVAAVAWRAFDAPLQAWLRRPTALRRRAPA